MSELTPVTRKEQFYDKILQAAESGGGGGGSTLIEKSISANGVYNASEDSADGYSKVTVDVVNSYTQADEGKVVSNGALVAQTTHAEITENGTYDITTNNSVSVNVSGGGNVSGIIDRSITEITIPNDVTNIGSYAFDSCKNLERVIIPYGIITIDNYAFAGCNTLSEIEIPDSVTTINDYVFAGCSSLASINIPHSVETIASHCFNNAKDRITINIYNRPNVISGAPWSASQAQINYLLKDRFTSAVNEVSSGTTLTTSVSCTVGDLVIATFIIRGNTYTFDSGWTLLGIGDNGASNQRTAMAYKIATSSSESLTVTQDTAGRMYINLVSITGASVGTFSGFTTQATGSSITLPKPQGLVVWGVSAAYWGTQTPYKPWEISDTNNMFAIQLPTTTQPRCLTALDQSNNASETFSYSPDISGDAALAAASLTITGIDNFWYYDD